MKEINRKCSKCGKSPSQDPGIVLYRFPKPGKLNSLRCESWAKYLYPEESIWASLEFQYKLYAQHKMLCNNHFKETFFIDIVSKKLHRFAVPGNGDEMTTAMVPITNCSSGDIIIEQVSLPVPKAKHKFKTKKEKKLYLKCWQQMKNICHLYNRIKKYENKVILKILSENDAVNYLIKNKLPPVFALLLQGQIKIFQRKVKPKRWTFEDKITALSLYKRSPTCYRLLRRLFYLPAPGMLNVLLKQFPLNVGINEQVFSELKSFVQFHKTSDKEFILMFGKMSVQKYLQYYNKNRLPKVSPVYALVYMVAGIQKKIKLTIAYYFIGSSITSQQLAALTKEVIHHCSAAGINISATVCKMSAINRETFGILGASVDHPQIMINGREIITLYDTPHLLKCFRNLFLKFNIEYPTQMSSVTRIETGTAKWSHLQDFFDNDSRNDHFVFAPALTRKHLAPNKRQKMKVKLAVETLSHKVAGGLYAKIAAGELPAEAAATANIIDKMDRLFDAVNADSHSLRRGKPCTMNMSNKSGHKALFKEMIFFFQSLMFVGAGSAPPSQEGWIWTLNGIECLWSNLTKKHRGIRSMATRRLQQDPLENLFACIRGHCGPYTNPNTTQFVAGLKTSILTNLTHFDISDCEKDDYSVMINDVKTLLKPTSITQGSSKNDGEIIIILI